MGDFLYHRIVIICIFVHHVMSKPFDALTVITGCTNGADFHVLFPNRDSGGSSKKEESPPAEAAFDDDFKKSAEKQDAMVSRSHRQVQNRVDSAWAVINQVYL